MRGIITAVIRRREGQNGGYGFIRDEENQERFFHARNLRGITFEALEEGTAVEFIAVNGGGKSNGLRAERVQVIA